MTEAGRKTQCRLYYISTRHKATLYSLEIEKEVQESLMFTKSLFYNVYYVLQVVQGPDRRLL